MKTFAQFITEASDRYEREFHDRIHKHWPNGIIAYHESPTCPGDSFRKHGINGDYGVFATIGQPSNFVTSAKKTIVKFRIPPHHNNPNHITPDMAYEPDNPHKDLLSQHPGDLTGADISLNTENVPPHRIISIEEK